MYTENSIANKIPISRWYFFFFFQPNFTLFFSIDARRDPIFIFIFKSGRQLTRESNRVKKSERCVSCRRRSTGE